MLFRTPAFRTMAIGILIAMVTYFLAAPWLISSESSHYTNIVVNDHQILSPSPRLQSEQTQPPVSSMFTDTPLYNELLSLDQPIRISITELRRPILKREYNAEVLRYDQEKFRQLSIPILWLDEQYDVRWNKVAENYMINYILDKQFPNISQNTNSSIIKEQILQTCRAQSLFLMHQHFSGFYSRVLCFVAQFAQTLYTPRIAVFRGSRFSGRGSLDDFLGQGIKRYFLPMSICSAYEYHSDMQSLKRLIHATPNPIHLANSKHLFSNRDNKDRALVSYEYWKPDYHHIPIRKWLFDRKKTPISYSSPLDILADHSDEHIYAPKNAENVTIGEWINTNKPDAFSSDLLPNDGKYKLTWKDHVFGSFLRYMFALVFYSRCAPRIEYGYRLLTQHWFSYLTDKYSILPNVTISEKIASLYIRRGDKSSEDSFWRKNSRWRNLSFYIRGIVDEEKRRNTFYPYVFVMTDDSSVMSSLQDYSLKNSQGTDEPYAREHLRGREILYNVLAPHPCFDPFKRIGYDQFLVSFRFLMESSAIAVGHTDSNVFRFMRELVYALRQQNPTVQSSTYMLNAPDSLETNT